MAVTVAGKNYTQISSCDSSTAGGTWLVLTTQDVDAKKEGTASLCGIVKTAGNNTVTFTPTAAVDLSGTKHVRFWFISIHGGLLNTYALDGLNFWASDGTNTGYWKILGKDTYPGGWINCVIDVSKACDSGTKPTNMNTITSMGYRINLTAIGKNAVNTWTDNLCVCDGLVAYGDDAGGYFDLDDIYTKEDTPVGGGWGVLRKIGGQYFATGSLEIGYATSATKFQTKSSVLVFENRRVNDALYAINVVDSGNASYTTEFILGSKSGTAGIEGCVIRVQDTAQTCKFNIDGGTDTDVDNFKLYGTTFFDTSTLKFPNSAANVEVLNCNFESCDEIMATTAIITNCNFVAAIDEAVALVSGNTHNMTYCNFMSNSSAVRIPNAGTYGFSGLKFINNTIDIDNTSGGEVIVNCVNGSDPSQSKVTGNTTINQSNPVYVKVVDAAGNNIYQAQVAIYRTSDNYQIVNTDTNEQGEIPTTTYNGTTDIYVRIRKSSTGATKYFPIDSSGSITASGYSAKFTLIEDTIAA